MEIWKDIEGFEGYYKISTIGNIKSLNRVIIRSNGWPYSSRGKILKAGTDTAGYPFVALRRCGPVCSPKIHRLVALAFIPNPENKREINHKNGIKTDNRVENLEWCTRSENMKHAFKNGLLNLAYGESHSMSKLNEFQVRVIRKCNDLTTRELGIIFCIDSTNIGHVKQRKTWKCVK